VKLEATQNVPLTQWEDGTISIVGTRVTLDVIVKQFVTVHVVHVVEVRLRRAGLLRSRRKVEGVTAQGCLHGLPDMLPSHTQGYADAAA
jgi:hypothetical protein